ncbi:hypothetical protein [Nostoc sp.]|uniref:hypothetical protein n=1 Tax=Nostoc sp. TaxID=1180 RepID=UPI002FF63DCD
MEPFLPEACLRHATSTSGYAYADEFSSINQGCEFHRVILTKNDVQSVSVL